MRVAICCKGVPIDAALESVQLTEGDIQYRETDYYINEFDAYALEAAMNLKTKYGAETAALSLGPLRAQEVLYYALAKGIDEAFRIDGETARPELIAGGIIPLLKKINPHLVLVGVQSEDWMGGEVGVFLSQALDMGLAYAVTEIVDLNETTVHVKKEIGGGRTAEMVVKLPVILCIQSGIHPLQYITKMKLRKARKNSIKQGGRLDIDEMKKQKISGMMDYKITEILPPSKEGHAEMLLGERPEKAAKLLDIIAEAL